MPKSTNISSAQRLKQYSKSVLVELVLELRDRFEHLDECSKEKTEHINLLLKKVQQQSHDLKQVRRKLREKGVAYA
jgi:hypothetical protein